MPDGSIVPSIESETHASPRSQPPNSFQKGLIELRPNLKAYACSLARNADVADDLVQETMVRALTHHDKFDMNTNLRAWLFTILKNLYRTKLRKGSFETELSDSLSNSLLCSAAESQSDALYLKEVTRALQELPEAQRNAVVLVGAFGYSIDEAAAREGCRSGTIKSRVSRGRSTLAKKTA